MIVTASPRRKYSRADPATDLPGYSSILRRVYAPNVVSKVRIIEKDSNSIRSLMYASQR